jgi:hypothetical protein
MVTSRELYVLVALRLMAIISLHSLQQLQNRRSHLTTKIKLVLAADRAGRATEDYRATLLKQPNECLLALLLTAIRNAGETTHLDRDPYIFKYYTHQERSLAFWLQQIKKALSDDEHALWKMNKAEGVCELSPLSLIDLPTHV